MKYETPGKILPFKNIADTRSYAVKEPVRMLKLKSHKVYAGVKSLPPIAEGVVSV